MELPETLIHRIQSFLTGKEAAQTTLLADSWRTAWSTRPTIDLDESHHTSNCISIDGLTSFANKTFRRYEESELSIDTFSLCLKSESYTHFGFAAEWILKAMKLGATDFTFRPSYDPQNIHFRRFPEQCIDIPLIDVFGSENVERLCLQRVNIDGLKVIKLTRLKSLTLLNLTMKTNQFFDIMLCLPSIEYFSLSDINSSRCSNEEQVVKSFVCRKLRSLVLDGFESQVQMKTLFLDDLSSKFPNLKDLIVRFNFPNVERISSGTLETLNLRYPYVGTNRYDSIYDGEKVARVELEVPSVCKFTFEGSFVPKLYFSPPPAGDQWVSHVSIIITSDLSINWFHQLSELSTKLKGSKIHLCIHMHYKVRLGYEAGEIDGLNVFEVEDLTLDTEDLPSLSCYALLDVLFRTCHPKMITQYDVTPPGNNRNNDLFICRSIVRAMPVKSVLLPTQFMYGLRDLEELEAQQLIDGVWKQQPLGSILDDSISEQRRFRLQLKWKPSQSLHETTP